MTNNAYIFAPQSLHTTVMGAERIRRNLNIPPQTDVIDFCIDMINKCKSSNIRRRGKNFYVTHNGIELTINANTKTIITAHTTHTLDK